MAKQKDKELKQTYIDLSLKIIKSKAVVFITDLVVFLPIGRTQFYNYELDKVDSIKEAIEDNKIQLKMKMRSKWMESPAPALQMALMKLISSDDERRALSTSFMETKQKHQHEDLSPFTDEELLQMMKDKDESDEQESDN